MPFPRRATALLILLVGCSSSGGGGTQAGVPTEQQAFSYLYNLIPTQVSEGGGSGTGYVDTGDPWVLLDPATFASVASLPANGAAVSSITIGGQDESNVYVVPTDEGLTSPDPSFPFVSNVGCTGICGYVATLNYRDALFGLGSAAPSPPSGLEPETVFPFSFEGGSVIMGVTVPRSRIVVTVSLEGNDYSMVLDSGATTVTVSQAAFTALTADGRAVLQGGMVETTSGESTSSLARAAKIVVGGVEVDSVVVAHDSSFDDNLQSISTDVGHTIDGSLGGTYLHDFYVTIDYPAKEVHLARYSNLGFAVDPAERIGIDIEQNADGNYVVAALTNTAAAQGINVDDQVLSISGVSLAPLDASQVAVLQYGLVGAKLSVSFGTASSAAVSGSTLPVVVEELLPQ
jgi:hypothetical protein